MYCEEDHSERWTIRCRLTYSCSVDSHDHSICSEFRICDIAILPVPLVVIKGFLRSYVSEKIRSQERVAYEIIGPCIVLEAGWALRTQGRYASNCGDISASLVMWKGSASLGVPAVVDGLTDVVVEEPVVEVESRPLREVELPDEVGKGVPAEVPFSVLVGVADPVVRVEPVPVAPVEPLPLE